MTEPARMKVNVLGVTIGGVMVLVAVWMMRGFYGTGGEPLIRANEAAAIDALRQIHGAELEWRRRDADGNALPDFWTGDVSGLCRAAAPDGSPCTLLDLEIAGADQAPLPATTGGRPRLTAMLPSKSWKGYWFRAMKSAEKKPLATDGPDEDTNAWENLRRFGFLAVPAKYVIHRSRYWKNMPASTTCIINRQIKNYMSLLPGQPTIRV